MHKHPFYIFLVTVMLATGLFSCRSTDPAVPVLFETLDHHQTGLDVSNTLTARPDFNMLKYMYFYNGAGIGAGDFNKDGLTDLFFASNQLQNRLYLNQGKLTFRDVTTQARIPDDGGWTTGVSVADVNDDGWLDIYVSRVGQYESLKSKNQLLICKGVDKDGVPFYTDEAAAYGLDFSGFSTQAAFFDYDLDGDLDMFLLNHSLRYNSTFAPRNSFTGTVDSLSRDILFRNDGNHFTDVSVAAGIQQSVIGYGLGIVISDLNLDGWPDIYIGNDFHENDYLYINNGKGGFRDELTDRTMHTSQFSMGVDAGDINNDGWPDIIAADMLPSDPYILRRSLGEDEYATFQIKIRNQYNHQYARNNLQLSRRNGLYSEIGLYAGVAATDWSWATLWMDFDNDGLKDLFVSNGIPKRLNDIDYVNYVSNEEIQSRIRSGNMQDKDMALIDKFPEIRLPNRFFRNRGEAAFEDVGNRIGKNPETFSNGSVYADFDNDGDQDIVVNNIDEPAVLYRNTANDEGQHPSLQLALTGPAGNRQAVGARLIAWAGNQVFNFEKFQARGFQSSMETALHISLGKLKADSAWLIWPDKTCQPLTISLDSATTKTISYQPGLPRFDFTRLHTVSTATDIPFEDITRQSGLQFLHRENVFNEFDREPLMPFMVSREGPALAVADINQDGLDDVFVGSVKWEQPAVFLQHKNATFTRLPQPALEADSTFEDTDACWTDVNSDGFPDLVVASGGNEYYGNSPYLHSRVYLNNGQGLLTKKEDALPADLMITASCVVPLDFNQDGHMDLFIGARAVPWQYGTIPASALLQNDGHGTFSNVTRQTAPELALAGLVKDAVMADINADGRTDLVLALEWDGICAFVNNNGTLKKQYLSAQKGWWNFILPSDIDLDGDIDFIAGNQGLNSRFTASVTQPVRFYYNDFDDNGKKDQVISYYVQGQEIPFANKAELERQMPGLKKKYLYAENFAKAGITDMFSKVKLTEAALFTADYFSNSVLINEGKGVFTTKALPWEAQLTSYRSACMADLNNDKLPDIILGGNFYPNNIQMGRYDADYGTLLLNKGKGNFTVLQSTLPVKGEVRQLSSIQLPGNQLAWILAKNDDSLKIIRRPRP